MSLLPVAEAQARLLALAAALPIETVPLAEAAGRWVAEDVVARRTQPAADLSAMDGYAVRHAELAQPMQVVGESAAGSAYAAQLQSGEAVRIFTGAPLPPGTDTILVQEEAAAAQDHLRLSGAGPQEAGAHVRKAGADFRSGDTVIPRGTRLTPAAIGLAASAGWGALPVRRRVRVALISTGDELVPAGAPTPGVMLPSTNAPMLAALFADLPVDVDDRGIVRDDLTALATAFGDAAQADLIVTTGGASVGDHDLVRPALAAAGAALDFWRVAMRPGKPLTAGRLGDAVLLGLPGNPVSAYVTALLFARPLIAHLSGAGEPLPAPEPAILAAPLGVNGPRADYVRARVAAGQVAPLANQDSAALAMLAQANALIIGAPHAPAAAIGDSVEILRLP